MRRLASYLINQAQLPCSKNMTYVDNLTMVNYWNSSVRYPAENSARYLLPFSGLSNIGVSGFVISGFLACLFAFLVTLLAGDLLARVPRRYVLRVIWLISTYVIYLLVSDYFISSPSQTEAQLSLFAAPVLFSIWFIFYDRKWVQYLTSRRSALLSRIVTVMFCCLTIGLFVTGWIDLDYLRGGSLPLGMSVFAFVTSVVIGVIIGYSFFNEQTIIELQIKNHRK